MAIVPVPWPHGPCFSPLPGIFLIGIVTSRGKGIKSRDCDQALDPGCTLYILIPSKAPKRFLSVGCNHVWSYGVTIPDFSCGTLSACASVLHEATLERLACSNEHVCVYSSYFGKCSSFLIDACHGRCCTLYVMGPES